MNYLIKQDSGLYKCYWLVQELRETLEQDDFNKFNTLVDDKSTLPRYMFTAIKTLRKYKRQIKNTMYYNGLSNGPLERLNNMIKVIKPISYGYRSFCNFRGKILLIFSLFSSSNTDKKPRYSKKNVKLFLIKGKNLNVRIRKKLYFLT